MSVPRLHAVGKAPDVGVVGEDEVGVVIAGVDVEPAVEPAIGGAAKLGLEHVLALSDDEFAPFRKAEDLVDAAGGGVRLPRAGQREEVLGGRTDAYRARGDHRKVLVEVEAARELSVEVLLVVGDHLGRLPGLAGSDVADGDGGGQALVEGADVGGVGAAAGAAGHAKARGIDVGARLEIVEGAHRIPDHVAGEVRGGGGKLDAEMRVLLRTIR